MDFLKLNLVVALAVVLLRLSRAGNAEKARALFVLGESYVDTGNHNPFNASDNVVWRRPYGFTWPGYPAGRFSSGKVQTDRWAEILGLPTPIAYERLKTHNCHEIPKKIVDGVNFAVGGSGIFQAFSTPTIHTQAEKLKSLINQTGVFDPHELARSVVIFSNVGNDYLSYLLSNGSNAKGLLSLVGPVVRGMVDVLKELNKYGLRNFVVSNVLALGCLPKVEKTSCDSSYDDVVQLHSRLLNESVQELRSSLGGLNIIITDLNAAFNNIFSSPTEYGFEELFEPCCAAKGKVTGCAEVDERGTALFEVCWEAEKRFFWDGVHPTHKAWHVLMSLYTYGSVYEGKEVSYVVGASNLKKWVESLGFEAYDISPVDEKYNLLLPY